MGQGPEPGSGRGPSHSEEAVEVTMPHVFKDHEQRAASADTEEAHDVLVLKHGEQLGLALEVLPALSDTSFSAWMVGVGHPWMGAQSDRPTSQLTQHPPPSRELGQGPSLSSPILSTLSWHDSALGGGPWTTNTVGQGLTLTATSILSFGSRLWHSARKTFPKAPSPSSHLSTIFGA